MATYTSSINADPNASLAMHETTFPSLHDDCSDDDAEIGKWDFDDDEHRAATHEVHCRHQTERARVDADRQVQIERIKSDLATVKMRMDAARFSWVKTIFRSVAVTTVVYTLAHTDQIKPFIDLVRPYLQRTSADVPKAESVSRAEPVSPIDDDATKPTFPTGRFDDTFPITTIRGIDLSGQPGWMCQTSEVADLYCVYVGSGMVPTPPEAPADK